MARPDWGGGWSKNLVVVTGFDNVKALRWRDMFKGEAPVLEVTFHETPRPGHYAIITFVQPKKEPEFLQRELGLPVERVSPERIVARSLRHPPRYEIGAATFYRYRAYYRQELIDLIKGELRGGRVAQHEPADAPLVGDAYLRANLRAGPKAFRTRSRMTSAAGTRRRAEPDTEGPPGNRDKDANARV